MKLGTSSSSRGQRAGEFWMAQYSTQNRRGDAPERKEEKKAGKGEKGGTKQPKTPRGEEQSQQNRQQRGGARRTGTTNKKEGGDGEGRDRRVRP